MEKTTNVESWKEVRQILISSNETWHAIPPLTVQKPLKKEVSSKRADLESLDMEVDSIHPSKNIKTNHDQDEANDVTIIKK